MTQSKRLRLYLFKRLHARNALTATQQTWFMYKWVFVWSPLCNSTQMAN